MPWQCSFKTEIMHFLLQLRQNYASTIRQGLGPDHIPPLLMIGSQVAQWLECPVRYERVVGSSSDWNSNFFSELMSLIYLNSLQ